MIMTIITRDPNISKSMLYFIKPLKLYQTSQNACYFDQTILPLNDTVSVGMTLTNKEAFRVDSIAFLKDNVVIKKHGKPYEGPANYPFRNEL